ncbi:DUF418 domain-containing protein [Jeotgalicoccus aerolatus]|uniref:DUF418 domain-containing protein n=1 Tax=Jeotgalicoccus aerolatus TaxID=709510 RepID=A0ABS4HK61_9STAP|nr:DUF418 domain-containing protein [Jeotgalicoccus aerolatus]MBP1951248.1 uncharacterized protein [Jeotgalicoccus aerolatus]NMA81665.1 DUF418 domain-containing protein [Jeotgalicoccus aerolatus]GGD98982.1 hypothetical protein GCM10007273_09300 [Jeotgalicoccus aerolatus]HJG32958.1 DUF418 domain-containing protein [Jeotgalicoccus aerolatus]
MTDSNKHIYFIGGVSLILLFIFSGQYFLVPLNEINPFEYFFGSELNIFNITDIITGGSVIPLIGIITGFLLSQYGNTGKKHLAKVLFIVLIILTLNAVLISGFDKMPFIILMAFIGLIFIGRHWIISLAASLILFAIHLMFNVVLEIINGLNSNIQRMYSGIQQVNAFISTYRSSDYLAIVNMNIDTLTSGGDMLFDAAFIILPSILLGVALKELNLTQFIKTSPFISAGIIMVLLAGGISTKLIQILMLGSITGETLGEGFGGPVTAIGYFMLLAYIAGSIPEPVFNIFYNMGRYSLSVYILFNIFMMFIFYGFGLAMYGQVSFQMMILTVLALYILLLIISNVLAHYNIRVLEQTFLINKKAKRE